MTNATYVGPVTNAFIHADVLVHQQNAAALLEYAREVSDPHSANYRNFLTPDEIAQRFGATEANYLAAAEYFMKNGAKVEIKIDPKTGESIK